MTKIQNCLTAAVVVCLICFCQVSAQQTNSGSHDLGNANQTTGNRGSATTFPEKAIEMIRAEIQLGQLGVEKAQDPRVKEFAQMTVRDHTQALDRLEGARTSSLPGSDDDTSTASREKQSEAVPQTANRSLLSREYQQTFDRLTKLSGSQFDKDFMEQMVLDHRNAVRLFEQESRSAGSAAKNNPSKLSPRVTQSQTDDAALAQELLPTLRQHLLQAEKIQQEIRSSNPR